jgi:hypothetical protein
LKDEASFTLQTQETREADLASYLYDMCAMAPVVIKVSLLEVQEAIVDYSFCNVLAVSSLSGGSEKDQYLRHEEDLPYCIEGSTSIFF